MKMQETGIEGLLLLSPEVYRDERGWFMETWRSDQFPEKIDFVQDNESCSAKGVLRGLHYQLPPAAMAKLVHVVRGAVLDVAVDLRKESPTCGRHYKVELNDQNKLQLFIPAGFAHGFLSLADHTVLSYKCSAHYQRNLDRSLRWNDPELAIEWGIENPLLSEKDRHAPLWSQLENPF